MVKAYQLDPKQVTCPVCHSISGHLLWSVNSNQAAQHFVIKEKDPKRFFELSSHIETLWGQTTCEVVQCNNCGFCFSNPYVAGDKQFYDLAYDRSGYPRWNWEHQRTYKVLRRLASPDLRLLEVGAGDGSFISRIVPEILPKEKVLCVEFSDYGKRKIQQFGVECLSDDIRCLSKPELEGKFDIVCMFQVLEHMDDLEALFSKLHVLMREGASLFVSAPNPEWIRFIELNDALLDMPPNHVGRWNRRCFAVIAEKTGFRIESYEIEELNPLHMVRQFVKYRFLRKSQETKSLANLVTRIHKRGLRLTLQAIGATTELIRSFPIIFAADKRMGMSQWVHLKKTA